jgi:hypothetical protein
MTGPDPAVQPALRNRRTDVVERLVRGLSPQAVREQRRKLLWLRGKHYGVLVVALGALALIESTQGRPASLFVSRHPFMLLIAALAPLASVLEYLRIKPMSPVNRELAEMSVPPGSPCPRCGEVPLSGALVCPSCRKVLRPLRAFLPAVAGLLIALLIILYRGGVFSR